MLVAGACVLSAPCARAADGGGKRSAPLPAISIIIDDIGYRRADGLRALELPGALAYAVLPHTPYGERLAEIAYRLDKEVLLHLPMEGNPEKALGPGALTSGMTRVEIEAALDAGLAAVPHASGVNNHMGSVLTADADAMRTLMDRLSARRTLYFVDSLTTSRSVALATAREAGVAATRRDVFLDADDDRQSIRRQFQHLVAIARANGTALGIGHPYPETLDVLRKVLVRPEYFGVELVSVTELIARRAAARRAKAAAAVPTALGAAR